MLKKASLLIKFIKFTTENKLSNRRKNSIIKFQTTVKELLIIKGGFNNTNIDKHLLENPVIFDPA